MTNLETCTFLKIVPIFTTRTVLYRLWNNFHMLQKNAAACRCSSILCCRRSSKFSRLLSKISSPFQRLKVERSAAYEQYRTENGGRTFGRTRSDAIFSFRCVSRLFGSWLKGFFFVIIVNETIVTILTVWKLQQFFYYSDFT